jgi:branched-chain amino acid transport system permease protein
VGTHEGGALDGRGKWLLAIAAGMLIFPLLVNDPYLHHLVILSLIFAILVSSWNVLFGFMGVFSFGHQAFFGIGAYVSALLATRLGVTPWLGFVMGGAGAAVASLVISWPTFRLKGPYVSIVTLAFAEVLRIVCSNWVDLTRGQLGLSVPTLFSGSSRIPYYYVILFMFCGTMGVVVGLIRSSFGLAAVAIREAQEAGESLGINVVKYKRVAFVTTSFLAGAVGAFYAHYIGILTPDVMGINIIFSMLVMGLFGGIGTLAGPILGSFALTFLAEYLRDLASYRFLIYSLIIMLVVLFLPGGLASGFDRLRRRLLPRRVPALGDSG